jgi:glycosyltransferase involved in cell wall biosynthesis
MGQGMVSEPVSAVIGTLNEADNIADCIASVDGVDEVVVCDDGSTDDTVAIAESLGAKVFRRADHSVAATPENVRDFVDRFGWLPSFGPGDRIRNGHLEIRDNVSHASHDWVAVPDADERVSWDLPRLRAEVLPCSDQVVGRFVHSHDENGDPTRVSFIMKLYRRSVTEVIGRTHTCIVPSGRVTTTDLMCVDHWQRPNHSQPYVLAIMEYSVLVDDDQRSRFYLGREYYYYGRYEQALQLLDLYLDHAAWLPEIAQARLYAALCYQATDRRYEARKSCLEAVLINPDHKEALALMAKLFDEPQGSKWAAIADRATDRGILF